MKPPQSIGLKDISVTVVVAKSVTFEKEGVPATISEIFANPDSYKFKLVKVSANRRQVLILYDSGRPSYMVPGGTNLADKFHASLARGTSYVLINCLSFSLAHTSKAVL